MASRVWLFLVTLGVVVALWEQSDTLDKVQRGRQAATQVTCAVASTLIEAGRQTITTVAPETPFLRFLEQHGYPPPKVRQAQSRAAAGSYGQFIARQMEGKLGAKGRGLVNQNGTGLNCAVLQAVGKTRTR